MRGKKLSKGTAIGLIVAGDLVLLLLGWFLLVSPQRSTAKTTARAAQAAEVQIEQAQAPAARPTVITQPKQPEIQTAYLYKLSKAMPLTTDMPNLLLELNQVVQSAGVQLVSITPSATDPTTGETAITLSVAGDFYSLTDLLYRLRSLVAVHNGALDVAGRLFSITSVGLTPSGTGRTINGSIALTAFTFGAAAVAAGTTAAPVAPVDTTGTTTGATTTTTPSASADTAIGH
jgi:type IV pilus assembly PilO-like protein